MYLKLDLKKTCLSETTDNVAWRQNGVEAVCNSELNWEYPCENAIDGYYSLPTNGTKVIQFVRFVLRYIFVTMRWRQFTFWLDLL